MSRESLERMCGLVALLGLCLLVASIAVNAGGNLTISYRSKHKTGDISSQQLENEYGPCIAEGFASDCAGTMQGYVTIHFPGIDQQAPLTFRLHESRAEELINALTKARADAAKIMEKYP